MSSRLGARPADVGRQRARDLGLRFGRELRLARMTAGLTQRQLAARARVSQTMVTRAERGVAALTVDAMSRMTAATGHELAVRVYPAHGVSLRDSGQLEVALLIQRAAHASWRIAFEEPIGPAPDRRAADLLLHGGDVAVHIEVERSLFEFQAQLRAAQLKRSELVHRFETPVRLVLAVPDTPARRRAVRGHEAGAVAAALPVPSRRAWQAIRQGRDPGGDALLWVRVGDRRVGNRHPVTRSPAHRSGR